MPKSKKAETSSSSESEIEHHSSPEKPKKSAKKSGAKGDTAKSAKKDDGTPKRPANAFQRWMKDGNRDRIKEENPDLKATDVTKQGGVEWKELDDEDKQSYLNEYKEAWNNYADEMEALGQEVKRKK